MKAYKVNVNGSVYEITLEVIDKADIKEAPKAAAAKPAKKKVNPVKLGIKARRNAAKLKKEQRDKYFHDQAVQAAIERRKQSQE